MARIPIVFTFDKRIIPASAIAIKSLFDNCYNSNYDVHILHSDISLNEQAALTKLTRNNKNEAKHTISFHYIDPSIFKGFKKSKGSWREIVYYRTIIPEILPYCDKVIYSDVDVFFKNSLEELFNSNLEGFELAAVRAEKNNKNTICHKYFEENKNEYIFWSGLLLLNCKKLREENYFEKFKNTALTFKDRLQFFDLDTINITCNNIKPLDLKYCVLEALIEFDDFKKAKDWKYLKDVYTINEINEAIKNPTIIHFAGELGKPWRRKKPPKYYKEYMDNLEKELRKYTFRDFRKKLFNKV